MTERIEKTESLDLEGKETCLTCRWAYIEEDGDMYCSRTGNMVYSDDGCFGGYEKEDRT